MSRRVAFPFVGSAHGGSYRSGLLLAKGLPEYFETVVVAPGKGKVYDLAKSYGLDYCTIDNTTDKAIRSVATRNKISQFKVAAQSWPAVLEYRDKILEEDIDIVHTHDQRSTLVWGLASKLAGKPLIWHIRRERSSFVWNFARTLLSNHAICVSESTQGELGLFANFVKTSVIYNPVDFGRVNGRSGSLRKELGISSSDIIIGYIGDFTQRKRPMKFARSTLLTLDRVDNLHVVMVGKDRVDYNDKIEQLVQQHDKKPRFHILGYRNDIGDILQDVDLIVMTSKRRGEAFPRVAIEAMASGTPVLATRSGGVDEAILDGETGRLLPSSISELELSENIQQMIEDKDLLEEFGQQAKKRAKDMYSSEIIANEVVEVYQQVLNIDTGGNVN